MKYLLVMFLGLTCIGAEQKKAFGVKEYLFDFSASTATSGTFTLSDINGNDGLLSDGVIVKNVSYKVIDALTSSNSASITVGNTATSNGYFPAALYSSFGANGVSDAFNKKSSLLWDDTNDVAIPYLANAANKRNFLFNVTAGSLTAGKVLFWVEYYVPGK